MEKSMRTEQQIQSELNDALMRAHAADHGSTGGDWASVARLEHELEALRESQLTDDQRSIMRLEAELNSAESRAKRAEARARRLEGYLSGLLGQPIDKMSPVKIGFRLYDLRRSWTGLANKIERAETPADLAELKRDVAGMALNDKRHPFQQLATAFGQA